MASDLALWRQTQTRPGSSIAPSAATAVVSHPREGGRSGASILGDLGDVSDVMPGGEDESSVRSALLERTRLGEAARHKNMAWLDARHQARMRVRLGKDPLPGDEDLLSDSSAGSSSSSFSSSSSSSGSSSSLLLCCCCCCCRRLHHCQSRRKEQ